MSGWKLLSALAASAPPALELDRLPTQSDAHTNVVAGLLSGDGRTVVARLPQAEFGFGGPHTLPSGLLPQGATHTDPEFTFIFPDGRRVPARFVGLDAATGLSLLEADGPVQPEPAPQPAQTVEPMIGQRLVLYAPAPVAEKSVAPRTQVSTGRVYASIGRAEAQLTDVVRAPSGRPYAVTARAPEVSPAWAGAVATDKAGRIVGIVSRSDAGVTQIVPVASLYRAVERVQATRSSAPQPWLGARGEAAARAPLEAWVNSGWEPAKAFPMIRRGQGVLLTGVAPGTPAARAGLRPGDLISLVNGREVRSVQDLSLTLKEQPIGSAVEFTILRALESAPVKLPVHLSGTLNPALATAEAETRAARENYLRLRGELNRVRAEMEKIARAEPGARSDDQTSAIALMRSLEVRLAAADRESAESERRAFEARARALHESQAAASKGADGDLVGRSLLGVGVRAIALTPRGAAPLGATAGGFLVISVEPGTPAAACGLLPGDLIESAGGKGFTPAAFGAMLRDAWENPVTLGVVRSGRKTSLSFSLNCDEEK